MNLKAIEIQISRFESHISALKIKIAQLKKLKNVLLLDTTDAGKQAKELFNQGWVLINWNEVIEGNTQKGITLNLIKKDLILESHHWHNPKDLDIEKIFEILTIPKNEFGDDVLDLLCYLSESMR